MTMTTLLTEATILIIDDDAEIRYSLDRVLSRRQYRVVTAASGEEGLKVAELERPHVIFLDNRMAGMSGIETLQQLNSVSGQAMIVLMTAYGTTQTAIEAMKFGAFDYIIKPFDMNRVLAITEKAVRANKDLMQASADYTPLLDSDDYEEGIVGSSEPMQEVFKMIGQVAATDATAMITGESGTGKELVARCIFQHSHRSNGPFMAVNCAAIPDNLIESELFGHEKGSFTGAVGQRIGKFELCDSGTIFLDEIGDMAFSTQTKILRVLQDGEMQRVGGSKTIKVDVRLIAATNKNLEAMVKENQFREDLYYRLNVVRIRMPALKERQGDVPQLVDFMLQRMGKSGKSRIKQVSGEALSCLIRYDWPGNVRELENVLQRSAVVAQGETILVKDLPLEISEFGDQTDLPSSNVSPSEQDDESVQSGLPESTAASVKNSISAEEAGDVAITSNRSDEPQKTSISDAAHISFEQLPPVDLDLETVCDLTYEKLRDEVDQNIVQAMELELIKRALLETGGNQVKTAAILGITRATLRKRIDANQLRY